MTTLESVRAKVVKAVPEIMELGVGGCVSHFLKGTGTILRVEKYEGESDCYYLGFLSLPEPIFELEPRNLNWQIIGRPIQLSDVLRAIEESKTYGSTLYMDSDGSMEYHAVQLLMSPDPESQMFTATWNLALPLDDQSPEVLEFLDKILTN